jgi:hypothetical protein
VFEAEVAAEGYLKSLPPAEELAVFRSIRGLCQREAGKWENAAESFPAAAKLAPACTRRSVAALTSFTLLKAKTCGDQFGSAGR